MMAWANQDNRVNGSKVTDVMIIVNDEVERLRMQAQADHFFYQLLKKDQPDQPSGLVNKPNPR
jgi:hypothetical protein